MSTKFEVHDNYRLKKGEPVATGECDGDKIVSIDGSPSWIGDAQKRNKGELTSVKRLALLMPRYTIIKDDNGDGSTEDDEPVEPKEPVEKSDDTGYEGEIVKLDPAKKQVFGWAYKSHGPDGSVIVDRSGEFIDDVAVLEESAYDYVLASRRGGNQHQRDEANEAIHASTMIESMVFTPEKIAKMGIPPGTIPQGAWWVGYQIHDDEVWKMFEDKRLTQFSIHGKGMKERVDEQH